MAVRAGGGWVLSWSGVIQVIALAITGLHYRYHGPLRRQRQRGLVSLASGSLLVAGWPDDDSQP
jgi:hypothetical protein